MADNVSITPGSGNIVAADEVADGTLGTVKVQYVKLMDGTIDGTTKGVIGANGLKVDGSGATQPVSGTVTVTQATGTNLHTVLDSGTTTVTQATGTNLHTVIDSGTVTANAGINLNTSALQLDATGVKLNLSQASITSGQTGPLIQGAVTTSSPTYITGQTNPLSLDTSGNLRVHLQDSQAFSNINNSTTVGVFLGTTLPAAIAETNSGGRFSGTADTARQGLSLVSTPTVFRTVTTASTGSTAIWTSATGNKWRLLSFKIDVTDNSSLAAGAVLIISLLDVAASINIAQSLFVPTTAVVTGAVAGGWTSGWINLGNFGILAAATGTALNVNLSAALATGACRVIVAGTEE